MSSSEKLEIAQLKTLRDLYTNNLIENKLIKTSISSDGYLDLLLYGEDSFILKGCILFAKDEKNKIRIVAEDTEEIKTLTDTTNMNDILDHKEILKIIQEHFRYIKFK